MKWSPKLHTGDNAWIEVGVALRSSGDDEGSNVLYSYRGKPRENYIQYNKIRLSLPSTKPTRDKLIAILFASMTGSDISFCG